MKKVLIISPYGLGSGNRTTADRIANHLIGLVEVTIIDAVVGQITEKPDFVILLHAYKAGKKYKELGLTANFGLIYGGTDLNQMTNESWKIIDELTQEAKFKICFSQDFYRMCTMNWVWV